MPSTVGDVLAILAARYPLTDAESWDRVGLLAGEPDGPAAYIVCALDPTRSTLDAVAALGANALVTHHPTYLQPEPGSEAPAYGRSLEERAQEAGIALLAFHTNLDVSESARLSLGAALPLTPVKPLVTETDEEGRPRPAFAQLWEPSEELTAARAAALLADYYQAPLRLTTSCSLGGGAAAPLTRVVTATGSGGGALDAAIAAGAGLLITGELKYHQLLEARDRGLSCVELGHDVSEWPLVAILHDTLVEQCAGRSVTVTLLERELPCCIVGADHGPKESHAH